MNRKSLLFAVMLLVLAPISRGEVVEGDVVIRP
jgi:hypothetical protein